MSTSSSSIESRVVLLDSGPNFADRYTAIIDSDYAAAIAMSHNPYHPQGVGIHVEVSEQWVRESIQRGQRIPVSSAPPKVQRCIEIEIEDWYS